MKGYTVEWQDACYNNHNITVDTIEEALELVRERTELGYTVTITPIF